jgi:hypothetical protein
VGTSGAFRLSDTQTSAPEVASGRVDAIVVEEYRRPAIPRGDVLWQQYVDNWLDYYTANGTLDAPHTDLIGPTEDLPQ